MLTFGEKLVSIRENKGISQKGLAELLDISPTRLNYWEKDKRQPDMEMIKKIVAILNISFVDLLGREEQLNPDGKLAKQVKIIEDMQVLEGKSAASAVGQIFLLNETGQEKAAEYVFDLAEQTKYQKNQGK